MTTTAAVPAFGCPRLIRLGRYARTFCNRRPVGPDGVCRRHRYVERQQKKQAR